MIEGVMANLGVSVVGAYNQFVSTLPPQATTFFTVLTLILVVYIYSWFIWKFYHYIATKNLLVVDLSKYNTSHHPIISKAGAIFFYLLEYIIILPFLIFLWFSVFTLFLVLLAQDLSIDSVLLISATIIGAIRMTAYYSEDLSKDLAKLLPFTLLGVSIVTPGFFDIERIITQISGIVPLVSDIAVYLLLIIGIETLLRFFDFLFSLFGLEDVALPPEEAQAIEEATAEKEAS